MVQKLWTKEFIFVFSIDVILSFVYFILFVTMSVYVVEKFDASISMAGLVTGIFIFGLIIGRVLISRIQYSIGYKKSLFLGLSFCILTVFLYFLVNNLYLLLFVRLLHGIAQGIAQLITSTVVVHFIPEKRRGEGIGIFSLSIILSNALGPLIGLYLAEFYGFQIILVISLIISVLGLVMSFFIMMPAISNENQVDSKFSLRNYIEYKAIPISFITLLLSFAYSGIVVFVAFYASELKLEAVSGFFFVVYSVTILISRPIGGRIFDKKGPNLVFYTCFLSFAAGLFLYSQVQNVWMLLFSAILIGLGFGNFLSSAQALTVKVSTPDRYGVALSTYFNFLNIGYGLAPYLLGLLVIYTGYQGFYLFMSIVVIGAAILYYFVQKNMEVEVGTSEYDSLSK